MQHMVEKPGIDFLSLKNQIGVFSMPMDVILDSVYLKTLSKEEYLNGYAEIFKHSFLTDSSDLSFDSLIKLDFFNDVNFIINKYSDIKNQIVKVDKYESNSRKVLNLGHTIGHALESYSHLSNSLDKLKHGEAIIIGLITELYISNKLNDFSLDTVDKLKEISLNYFSKISLKSSQNHSKIMPNHPQIIPKSFPNLPQIIPKPSPNPFLTCNNDFQKPAKSQTYCSKIGFL